MKVRTGFVSNSSSCSFVVVSRKKYLDWVVLYGHYTNDEFDSEEALLKYRLRDLGTVYNSIEEYYKGEYEEYEWDGEDEYVSEMVKELEKTGADDIVIVDIGAGNEGSFVSRLAWVGQFDAFRFPPSTLWNSWM